MHLNQNTNIHHGDMSREPIKKPTETQIEQNGLTPTFSFFTGAD